LLSDVPATRQEDFHEEPMLTLFPCLIHHGEEAKAEIPQDVQGPPALLTERTTEEEMECCILLASGCNMLWA
jgi:hypothetical protein